MTLKYKYGYERGVFKFVHIKFMYYNIAYVINILF